MLRPRVAMGDDQLGSQENGQKFGVLWDYLISILLVFIALLLQYFMQAAVADPLPPFLLIYPMLFLVTWISGTAPGLLATALATLGVKVLFMQPVWTLDIAQAKDRIALLTFIVMGIVFSAVIPGIQKRGTQRRLLSTLETLAESEARLALSLDAAELGTFTLDLETKNAWRSERHGQIFGYTPPLPDWNFDKFMNHVVDEDREYTRKKISEAIREAKNLFFECRIRRVDGAIRWIEIKANPSFRDHTVSKLVGVVRDITERKNSEESIRQSERIYRAIGESLDYGVWVCDAQGKNTYASDSLLKLLGITQEQCSSFGWGDSLHPDDSTQTIAAWKECVATGKMWDREHRYRGVDGQWHPVLARGVPIRNERGEIIQWAGINLDISRLKQTEQQLRDAIAARDEFLSIASHELKTPLTAIQIQLQLINRLVNEPIINTSRMVSVTSNAIQTGQRFAALIDDLLDITRIRSGKFSLERQETDLRAILLEEVKVVQEQARQNDNTITVFDQNSVIGNWDPARIRQVVSNLLSNAIKYGKGKPIEINVWMDPMKKCGVLKIRDFGIGIEPGLHAKIFERFERANTGKSIGGLGLGLYIVKKIVEAHGGKITVRSEPEKGSEFTVELPNN